MQMSKSRLMQMSKSKYVCGHLLPLLLWMVVIFAFSSQNGDQVGGWINTLVKPFVPTIAMDPGLVKFSVQKMAHFLEYAVLAMLAWRALRPLTARYPTQLAGVLSLLYAASDEWHQSFVPGRGPSLRDVAIDGLGIIFGLALLQAMLLFRRPRNTSPDKSRL